MKLVNPIQSSSIWVVCTGLLLLGLASCANPALPGTQNSANSRSVAVWHLEDNMKNATSLAAIAGVYWSARDMDSSPIGNHHFITIIYESQAQAASFSSGIGIPYVSYANQKGLQIYYTTIAAYTDTMAISGNMLEYFDYNSDVQAVKEQVNPKKYIFWYKPDYDFEGHRILGSLAVPSLSSLPDWITAVVQKALNFNHQYDLGNRVNYNLVNENCATMVDSLFNSLGLSAADRETLGEFSGVDWGEENLISSTYFAD